jgi:rhomboid protease GluP
MIPARSRQQAMDWGLVLMSQGIEATIKSPDDGAGWGLLVGGQDYERSREILHQYLLENRRWPWRQQVSRQGLLFDWGSLAWVFLTVVFYWLEANSDLRLFTALWLHADVGHLAANASIGLVLLGLVMGHCGTGVGLLAAYLAGAAGNLAAWLLWPPPYFSLGASGMVMACLGLLAAQSFSYFTRTPRSTKLVISGVAGGLMLFVLFGVGPETDVLAHLGGFAAGLVIGIPLARKPALREQPAVNLICGLIFALLVILPWWLALSRGAAR